MVIKKVLVAGGTGVLGKALIETQPADIDIYVTYLHESVPALIRLPTVRLDIKDKEQVLRVFEWSRPEVVIHLAGVGSVDFAEKHQRETRVTNVGGTQNVVEACRQYRAKLVYLSSNAVFDGEHPPYHEESTRSPVNCYGRLKVEAEDLVQGSGLEYSIVRAILMYGWHYPRARPNPVTTWVHALKSHQPVKVVNDRVSQPLFAEDCAVAIWRIITQNKMGVYHVAGADRLSLYEFALQTAEIFSLDKGLIEPVPSSYFPEIAPRPLDTSFSTLKARRQLQIRPMGVEAGLRRMKESHPC